MFSLSEARRYFLYRGKTDMRKSFDGLSGLVRNKLLREPLSGEVFVFMSRRRNQIRLLIWEGDGFSMYCKRLEKGTFEIPDGNGDSMEITSNQLLFIIKGIRLESVRQKKRFSLNKK
ncbi:MAG: IS66 family insertion sequence element accessory protein TnpB [Sporocytophaga sp.]|nr:IS66 family insertion sequence element accessory protein TnpB [Sporocytophaga sp.]